MGPSPTGLCPYINKRFGQTDVPAGRGPCEGEGGDQAGTSTIQGGLKVPATRQQLGEAHNRSPQKEPALWHLDFGLPDPRTGRE